MAGPRNSKLDTLQDSAPLSLTVIILTRDEAIHLPRVLASVANIAERVIIVDSGSTDETINIALQSGASVFERPWLNYADQFQWALGHCGIDTEWVMRLDADEWIGPDLVRNLRATLPALAAETTGISLDRQHHFLGRWIKHGGRYPLSLLRIWRPAAGRIEQRWMDEHIILTHGDILHVRGKFVDDNQRGLGFFTTKHNVYASREAADILIAKYQLDGEQDRSEIASTGQAKRKRSAKLSFYNRLPLGVGPAMYFLFRYIFQRGFLDGRAGLIYHLLQGFWYRFLVDAKRYELERAMVSCKDAEERLDALEAVTGLGVRKFLDRSKGSRDDG
ncbi:glycosyltransferase family 2 protein [Pontixanthobacter gangjinensis]|uniref:Glycosyltransferase n=1 Tax=Pontixanthobacter gangjinensis TaxID=1028742 RepID=A0A6I4SM20_9SPHN|nr:glycosyltransferase family 2 protein [Pontixanthobacter gangjinensis]MXO55877.1 glycosyltransferase [Pontixanthobacter gangjinensis]